MLIIVVRVYYCTQKCKKKLKLKESLFFTTQNKMQNKVTTGFVITFFIGGILIGGVEAGPLSPLGTWWWNLIQLQVIAFYAKNVCISLI